MVNILYHLRMTTQQRFCVPLFSRYFLESLCVIIQIWSHPGWSPLKTLAGHESKVMCVDISPGEKHTFVGLASLVTV
jgi:cell wall assembly regulator SMI1